jgi:hypothetical protein
MSGIKGEVGKKVLCCNIPQNYRTIDIFIGHSFWRQKQIFNLYVYRIIRITKSYLKKVDF